MGQIQSTKTAQPAKRNELTISKRITNIVLNLEKIYNIIQEKHDMSKSVYDNKQQKIKIMTDMMRQHKNKLDIAIIITTPLKRKEYKVKRLKELIATQKSDPIANPTNSAQTVNPDRDTLVQQLITMILPDPTKNTSGLREKVINDNKLLITTISQRIKFLIDQITNANKELKELLRLLKSDHLLKILFIYLKRIIIQLMSLINPNNESKKAEYLGMIENVIKDISININIQKLDYHIQFIPSILNGLLDD
jgi:hypothetical protein